MTRVPSYYLNSTLQHSFYLWLLTLFVWWAPALKFQRWPNLILWFVSGETRAMLLLPGSPSSRRLKEISKRGQPWQTPKFLALRLVSYQSVANQYHKLVCSRVSGVLFVLMDSYVDLEYKKYRGKNSSIFRGFGCHLQIDRSSILGDAIYYLNELLQRINDLHNELESTPLGSLPQASTSFHPLAPTPDTLSCRVKKDLCPSS
ncbi:unnamed protein product [Brassica oleracea var. botrytis]|uniref:BHLH domain-containing protein n=3 Tax=Brassica TaxID=3705 RepID=A0A0D3E8X2_BRAOL|nr:hypothetical protein HID58_087002 [Brassica napus]CAF1746506.1 unnamed protein product [Brassica napus]VDD31162.1 unnamed protein product [Brassica oleracea]